MKSEELKAFKKLLLERRAELRGSVSNMEEQALKGTGQDFSVDHMADYGSDNYEQEFTLGLIENEQEVLRDIDAALERIEEGTFGDCEVCGKKIQKARLKAIPYARLCLDCKKKEEERSRT
jgi:RNA polymerase-binding protein DksA